jgi:hypothetical protein
MQMLAPCSWQGSRYYCVLVNFEQSLVQQTRKKPNVVGTMLPSRAAAHVSRRESQNAEEHLRRKFQIEVSLNLEHEVKHCTMGLDGMEHDDCCHSSGDKFQSVSFLFFSRMRHGDPCDAGDKRTTCGGDVGCGDAQNG